MKVSKKLKDFLVESFASITGYDLRRRNLLRIQQTEPFYLYDGLWTYHNHEFMQNPAFQKAYQRGTQAAERDYKWYWRVHIGLWAAYTASKLEGDFVECGVNYGVLSTAIMAYLDWDSLDKEFWLLDTFAGVNERYTTLEERQKGILERSAFKLREGRYVSQMESVQDNFSQWQNVNFVQGAIPETLQDVQSQAIAYLHIDMNCSPPEVAAVDYFWPRMVHGGIVLFDDYAYAGYETQKYALDEWATNHHIQIVSLPTGQGLLIKS